MKGWITGKCSRCGKDVDRYGRPMSVTSREHLCYRCLRTKNLGKEKPLGFDDVPNTPKKWQADLDYHGKVE